MRYPDSPTVEQLFDQALVRPSPAERRAFLDGACAGDARLRDRVEALLRAHDAAGNFLGSPAMGDDPTLRAPLAEGPGTVIDEYKLLQLIGEGGFGAVYLAEQKEPVKRKVALKIIKLGMDTKQVIARFEAERQALAMMDHPGIARVLNAGATTTGRPYFVMDYVRGVDITTYCDTERLDTEERLRLFTSVCHAIQHAHQKGIIHRDIKPGNVMVTLHDGVPVPKVIDFGVAKATSAELTQKTLFTEHRQMIGTPAYMSPEQAEMSGLDIDTRSDVYSLGVLLYELLTGSTPFDTKSLMEAGFPEMMRIIREEEPLRPSTKLSSLGDTATRIAQQRRADVKRLGTLLRGDLDWIVMKCLEKDRTRRYETANDLARDIQRHLFSEPVLASPPSAIYRLKKLIKRNKIAFSAAAVVLIALSGGLIGTIFGLTEAIAAREAERERAEELEAVAEFQSEQLGDIDAALMGVRWRADLLASVRAAAERSRLEPDAIDARVDQVESAIAGADFTGMALRSLEENVFAGALEAIDTKFSAQPLVQARLLQTVADTLRELGLLEEAAEPQERALAIRREALGDKHPDTLTSIDNMGLLLKNQGRPEEAEAHYNEALEGRRRLLGDEHVDTLASINNSGDLLQSRGAYAQAEVCFLEALVGCRRVLGDDHPGTLTSINNMGSLLSEQGRYDEAEPYYREALETRRRTLGDEHPDTLISINDMGLLLKRQGRYDEAEPYYREALAGYRKVLGDDHPYTLIAVSNMGTLLRDMSRFDEAEPYYEEALRSFRRILGDEHPDTLISINNMGLFLRSRGRHAEAERYGREALAGYRRVFGDEHPSTLNAMNSMGIVLQGRGQLDEAEMYYREALDGSRRILGDEHPRTLSSISNMGFLLQLQGRYDEAEPLYREALETRRRVLGDDHPSTLISINNMGSLLRDLGRLAEADAHGAEAVERGRAALGEDHWRVGLFLGQHASTLFAMKRFADAEERALAAYTILEGALGHDHDRTRKMVEILINLYEAWDEAEPGSGHGDNAAEWRARTSPSDAPGEA